MNLSKDNTQTLVTELDALRKYAHDLTIAITGLAGGGSELFGKQISGMYTADIPYCVNKIRDRELRSREQLVSALRFNKSSPPKPLSYEGEQS